MKVLKNKTIYAGNGKTECGYIRYDTIIAETGPMSEFIPQEDDEVVLTEACTVIPGFIDVHSHGGYGFDSMDASPEEIDTMVRRMTAEEGITSYFCTTMTQSYEQIETAMKNIRAAAEQNPVIQGIHVEGPFVSANYKGAQNEEYIRKPDARALARWNDLSGGRIRIVTLAPEEASPAGATRPSAGPAGRKE